MNLPGRPLSGFVVSLSISSSGDSSARGFPPWQINRTTLQSVSALFGQGVGVIFGHDWRDDGIMEAVHGFAMQMQPLAPTGDELIHHPLLQNLVPWPDTLRLGEREIARLATTLRVEQAGVPAELEAVARDLADAAPDDPRRQYVRARALTHLRHQLVRRSHARLCMGGPTGGTQGRYPGIIEEAFLSVVARQPVYLAGLLGGAARQIIDATEGREMPKGFCEATKITELLESPPSGLVERDPSTKDDRTVDRQHVWLTFQREGVEGLSRLNGLSPDHNRELFHTPLLDRVFQLVLTGLSRLRHDSASG